ncbi:EF-P 5-aminopentanol modification-associated protein YfmH [Anaeromicrobium sediminis]|uniref:Peptidase M16 n=1 Tax=Anaeromicrobium sediminis TaxID=1478221 RepID=A0A267MIR2_9FIRM|nr:pitrilysin family protein [Anaeromicrobium sediminis]PAB58818.1 peptidase M16 [Anaeromicrobium sediminis]
MENKIIQSSILKESMSYKKLDCGLEVYYMPKTGYSKQYAIFATKYGSNDSKFIIPGESEETHVPDGIAHFLEHKLFEEKEGSIFDKFSELGSSVNAYTNFTSTCYLFSCTDRFYENLELLMNFVQNPYFTDENVEKEKGIISQEIRMYDDNSGWKVFFNALRAMYHNHPVKIDIAGTVESITKITKEDLYKCYNTFYNLNNMVVFVVGDLEEEKVFKTIEDNLKEEHTLGEIKRIYPNEPNSVVKKIVEEKLDVSIPLFNVCFKDSRVGTDGKELLKKEISTKILLDMLFGKSSELYSKLYEEGLINDSFEADYTGDIDYGHSMVGGESKDPKLVKDKIMEHVEKIKKEGLCEKSFERVKKKLLGKHLSSYNSVDNIATTFIAYKFKNMNIFDYVEVLDGIDFNHVNERFKDHIKEETSALSIVSPK